jgi:ureidoglycolate lyase
VRTDPRPLQVEALERHDDREEWVYALDQPVVQVVALSAPGQPDRPDAASVAAFLLRPGQGVVVERGIWHSAGLPAGQRSVYYGFVLGPARPDAPPPTNPWIPFAGGECIILEFPPGSPKQ